MLALSVLARLPLGINALAIVLLLRHEGYAFGAAGAAAGAMAIGVGGSSPFIGRLIDRRGQREVLAPLAISHALGLGAIDRPLMNANGAMTTTEPGNASGRKPSGSATAQRG